MPPVRQIQSAQGRHSHQRAPGPLPGFSVGLGANRRADPLPEHETRWPATEELREAIVGEWDGDAGAAHDLGRRFHNAAGESYPSWRIQDIARDLGIFEERQAARIQSALADARADLRRRPTIGNRPPEADVHIVREEGAVGVVGEPAEIAPPTPSGPPESEATMPEPVPEPTAATAADGAVKPTATKERVYPTRQAVCPGCGVTFLSTHYSSSGWTLYHSRGCGGAHRQKVRREQREAAAVDAITPASEAPPHNRKRAMAAVAVEPTEVYASRLQFGPGGATLYTPPPLRDEPMAKPISPRRQLRQSLHLAVDALPDGDTWTTAERSRWLEMVVGLLDFTVPATPDPSELLDWRVG